MLFLEILFYIILSFYILGFLLRLWLRWFIRRKQKQFMNGANPGGFYSQTFRWGGAQENKKQPNKNGIKIDEIKQPEKKVNNKVGDYVDFEEID